MPNNLGSTIERDKGRKVVANLTANCASVVEAVYIFFWGRQALEHGGAYWISPAKENREQRVISTLTEFRPVKPQM